MSSPPDRPEKPTPSDPQLPSEAKAGSVSREAPLTAKPASHPSNSADLYQKLYSQDEAGQKQIVPPVEPPRPHVFSRRPDRQPASVSVGIPAPQCPLQLAHTGLTGVSIGELIIKQLSLQGNLQGLDLSRQLRLRYPIVEEVLQSLRTEKWIEILNGDSLGTPTYRYHLTDSGRQRAREAFEQCRYLGPAPVPLEQYLQQCQRQTVAGLRCPPETLQKSFENLVVSRQLLDQLGPAVCNGRSLFLYGPPGNGKTAIAKGLGKLFDEWGGEIYVPYALQVDTDIITLFDPSIHKTTQPESGNEEAPEADWRWRKIKRPVVMTGGELTLEMLELRYHRLSNLYTAPLHIKANGGIFLIDDFGRQLASPSELLNRWILPLEERTDYLTLATGKKIAVPFEQFIVFSTNLEPRHLVDEAFLRRIRHKISVESPSRELYTEIFRRCCEQSRIPFSSDFIQYLYSHYYDRGKMPRSSDPRDLLEMASSICRFKNQSIRLTPELLAETSSRFFCQI